MNKRTIRLIAILGGLGLILTFVGALLKLEHLVNANYIISLGLLLQFGAGAVAVFGFLDRKQTR